MKCTLVLLFTALLHQSYADVAAYCEESNCDIADNCRCSSTVSPLAVEETPQLVVLAFIDAARDELYNTRWSPLVEPRLNPDGEYITATFYINHEYSNYQIVHDLAANGFEIGVHSVTNNPDQDYWRNASESLLEQEFGSQRKIIAKFANIPIENVIGGLTPQLQLAGDNSIKALINQGFQYDNSWPSKVALFPYTLDYASTQDCDLGAGCPKDSYPGFWIAPIVDLKSEDGDVCNTISACFRTSNNQSADEIAEWLAGEVEAVKKSNRAPMTLIVEQNLFDSVENSYEGLSLALDKLQEDKEIFFVSQSRVIEWLKNPVSVSEFTTSAVTVDTSCVKSTCNLKNLNGEDRTMVSCVPCPNAYPWLDNPEGI